MPDSQKSMVLRSRIWPGSAGGSSGFPPSCSSAPAHVPSPEGEEDFRVLFGGINLQNLLSCGPRGSFDCFTWWMRYVIWCLRRCCPVGIPPLFCKGEKKNSQKSLVIAGRVLGSGSGLYLAERPAGLLLLRHAFGDPLLVATQLVVALNFQELHFLFPSVPFALKPHELHAGQRQRLSSAVNSISCFVVCTTRS